MPASCLARLLTVLVACGRLSCLQEDAKTLPIEFVDWYHPLWQCGWSDPVICSKLHGFSSSLHSFPYPSRLAGKPKRSPTSFCVVFSQCGPDRQSKGVGEEASVPVWQRCLWEPSPTEPLCQCWSHGSRQGCSWGNYWLYKYVASHCDCHVSNPAKLSTYVCWKWIDNFCDAVLGFQPME